MDNSANNLFLQLAVVLGLSASLGFIIRSLKLPLIVAYLIAGVLLSLVTVFDVQSSEVLTFLPEIGIAFVLFFIGMELDIKDIRSLGRPILIAGLGQIILSTIAGFAIAGFLGFPQKEALFLGIGLSVSSTIVVVKLLLDKKELTSLYGKLALGILLLEDLVSVLILMALTVGSSFLSMGFQSSMPLIALILKGIGLFALTIAFSHFILAGIFKAVARSSELLFLSAVAWCFVFVALSLLLGFSVIIGAFLAGVALANSPFHYEIQGKVKPLRDFFVTLFFVYLGSQVAFEDFNQVVPIMVVFTLFALVIKPIIFMLILGTFGFKKHTLFQTAISLSQISEFSLIIMLVGLKLGVVSQTALTAMALTGVMSIILSSSMIASSKKLYKKFSLVASFFEHTKYTHAIESRSDGMELEDHVVLVGAHRIGGQIADFFKKEKIPLVVLDFNPKTIAELASERVRCLYGDVGDPEIFDYLNLNKAKLIISTAPDKDDQLILLSEIKKRRTTAAIIVRASSVEEAQLLYQEGADYVIFPEIVAGDYIIHLLRNNWPSLNYFKDRSRIELERLAKNHFALN